MAGENKKLRAISRGRNVRGLKHGVLVEFKNRDQETCRRVIPYAMLLGGKHDAAAMLADMGLEMDLSRPQEICDQIRKANPERVALFVDKTGWHRYKEKSIFVLPGEVIGEAERDEVFFESDSPLPDGIYDESGTLQQWRENIGDLCRGNSRLILAVCSALASPLIWLTGDEPGGFNLHGKTSTGKTTALNIAASVWGSPERLKPWRATDNALEGTAVLFNDSLLCLDELSQVDADKLGEIVYMLANGEGKGRLQENSKLRESHKWRTLLLSSGEKTMEGHILAGAKRTKSLNAGQKVRFVDVPAIPDGGYGLYEELHNFPDGAALTKELKSRSARLYGAPARALLRILSSEGRDEILEFVRRKREEFISTHIEAGYSSEVKRVCDRFALLATAGELATKNGITGWQPGDSMRDVAKCFQDWIKSRGGIGSQETKFIIDKILNFIQAERHRFLDFPPSPDDGLRPASFRQAGYIERKKGEGEAFLIFPAVFQEELFPGESQYAGKILAEPDVGILRRQKKGTLQTQRYIPSSGDEKGRKERFYIIVSPIEEDSEQQELPSGEEALDELRTSPCESSCLPFNDEPEEEGK